MNRVFRRSVRVDASSPRRRRVGRNAVLARLLDPLCRVGLCAALALAALWSAVNAQTSTDQPESGCVSRDLLAQMTRAGKSVVVATPGGTSSQKTGAGKTQQGTGRDLGEEVLTLQQARDAFTREARKGNAAAQVNLAVLSISGLREESKAGAALYWLTEAARQAYPAAYFDLGILYQTGCGVRKDYREAARYFRLGADANDARSQMNLGYLYDQGLGVGRDAVQAAVWYRQAAEAGLPEAQYNLADLYVRGEGVPLDEPAAFSWFQKAAQQGHTTAQLMLAAMYAQGRGTPKDLASAYVWLTVAELQGDARAGAQLQSLEPELTPKQITLAKAGAEKLAQSNKHAAELASLR